MFLLLPLSTLSISIKTFRYPCASRKFMPPLPTTLCVLSLANSETRYSARSPRAQCTRPPAPEHDLAPARAVLLYAQRKLLQFVFLFTSTSTSTSTARQQQTRQRTSLYGVADVPRACEGCCIPVRVARGEERVLEPLGIPYDRLHHPIVFSSRQHECAQRQESPLHRQLAVCFCDELRAGLEEGRHEGIKGILTIHQSARAQEEVVVAIATS